MLPLIAGIVAGLVFGGCAATQTRSEGERGEDAQETSEVGCSRFELLKDRKGVSPVRDMDTYMRGMMQNDRCFRIYSYRADWCPACKINEREIADLQKRRDDIHYIGIDVDAMGRAGIACNEPGLPMNIVQYGDCMAIMPYMGAAPADLLEEGLAELRRQCADM